MKTPTSPQGSPLRRRVQLITMFGAFAALAELLYFFWVANVGLVR